MNKSFKVMVRVSGESSFNTNGIRLATIPEAEAYAKDLYSRWMLMEEWRIEESEDEVNYSFKDGQLTEVKSVPTVRPLYEIAEEIKRTWENVWFGAVPYLDAMGTLDSIEENYGLDSGKSIVLYFLANAQTWKGEDARRIKKELRKMAGLK